MRINAGLCPVLGRSLTWNCRVLGLGERIGTNGSVWTVRFLCLFVGSFVEDLQGELTVKETKDFTNSS